MYGMLTTEWWILWVCVLEGRWKDVSLSGARRVMGYVTDGR